MRLSSRLRSSLLADQQLSEEASESAGDSKADFLQHDKASHEGKRCSGFRPCTTHETPLQWEGGIPHVVMMLFTRSKQTDAYGEGCMEGDHRL